MSENETTLRLTTRKKKMRKGEGERREGELDVKASQALGME